MWFNSILSEEPHLGLTCSCKRTETCDLRGWSTGAAWLSSARVVRCSVQSGNERNPRPVFQLTTGDCPGNGEEGEDDVKSAWPLYPGRHTWYNGRRNWTRNREVEQIPQNRPQYGLEAATRLHEAGIASKRASATAR